MQNLSTEKENSDWHMSDVDRYFFNRAISNDRYLQKLHAEKFKIYSIVTPVVKIKENGEVETSWLDEKNHPNLSKINELIKQRHKEILNLFKKQN